MVMPQPSRKLARKLSCKKQQQQVRQHSSEWIERSGSCVRVTARRERGRQDVHVQVCAFAMQLPCAATASHCLLPKQLQTAATIHLVTCNSHNQQPQPSCTWLPSYLYLNLCCRFLVLLDSSQLLLLVTHITANSRRPTRCG
jgi:hypothetical protein